MGEHDETMKLARRQVEEHDRLYPGAPDNDTTRFARALLEAGEARARHGCVLKAIQAERGHLSKQLALIENFAEGMGGVGTMIAKRARLALADAPNIYIKELGAMLTLPIAATRSEP